MPIYKFLCPNCDSESTNITKASIKQIECSCGAMKNRKLPIKLSSEILEMRDSYRGVQLPKNHEAKMKKRMRDHSNKYETAEKIDRQGIDTADRLGWTKNRE